MKFITRVVIVDIKYTTNKISQFYFNAKRNKYNHTYGYEDVFKDIQLAYQDRQLYPSNKTIQKWIDNGFDVARNKSLELVSLDTDICVCTDIDEVFEPGWRENLEKHWVWWYNKGCIICQKTEIDSFYGEKNKCKRDCFSCHYRCGVGLCLCCTKCRLGICQFLCVQRHPLCPRRTVPHSCDLCV